MTAPEYVDFDLAIEPASEGFQSRVLTAPAGQAHNRFSLPFSSIELENFVLKVGRTRAGMRKMGSPEGIAAETFGRQLYEAVFDGEVGVSFRRSIDAAALKGQGLRVRFRVADHPSLSNIPWEFVWAEGLGRFIALSIRTPLVRFIELPTPIHPLQITPPLRILLMVSNPTDVDQLDVEKEVALLRKATEDLERSGRIELVVEEQATLDILRQRLRREEFHVFHFIGHGGFEGTDGVLAMEDANQRAHLVKGQHLGTLLHDAGSLRLAVLNSCEGGRSSAEDPFGGVAHSLVRQGVPAVIAMQFEITDEAAIKFAHEFYLSIADGYPVDAAVGEARKAIFSANNDLEWATPVLYMRAEDGRIFDVTASPIPRIDSKPEPDPKPQPKLVAEEKEEEDQPDPVPPTTPRPPVHQRSRPRRTGLIIAAAVGIPLVGLFTLFLVIAALVDPDPPSNPLTTIDMAGVTLTSTTLSGSTVNTLPDATVTAVRVLAPPVIDADGSEWRFTWQAESVHVVAQTGSGDVTPAAGWWIAWDDQALYVFADAIDHTGVLQPWADQPDQLWRGDSVHFEFGPDPRQLDASAGLRPEDVHVLLGPIDQLGVWRAIAGVNRMSGGAFRSGPAEPAIEAVSVITDSPGYWLEARIPWQVINVSNPAVGDVFGMNLNLSDGGADLQVMVSTNPNRIGANQPKPGTWQTMVLGP